MTSGKVLLVIDMQKGSFTDQTPRYDTDGVVSRINALSSLFRDNGQPVIFIQHDGSGTGHFEKHTEDWQMLDDLNVYPNDILIDKYANDVFHKSNLQNTIDKLGVNHLYITGCATDFCVESTIQSAITKAYNITIVEDGHTTGERPHLSAQKVIEHYNWVWQNMIPAGGDIAVLSCADIKQNMAKI